MRLRFQTSVVEYPIEMNASEMRQKVLPPIAVIPDRTGIEQSARGRGVTCLGVGLSRRHVRPVVSLRVVESSSRREEAHPMSHPRKLEDSKTGPVRRLHDRGRDAANRLDPDPASRRLHAIE
jgi:hypothetical protein